MGSGFRGRHLSSSLPEPLDAHLFPVGVGKAGIKIKAEPWMKAPMQDSSPDQEARFRRQAQLDQRHLETYRNMYRLRDALCHRYAALLKDKVDSQRALLQQRGKMTREKLQNQTNQRQRKRPFSKLQHDDSFLKSLPKTNYYQIFEIQKQLVEHGHLKTRHQLEELYSCLKYNSGPSKTQRSLQDVRKNMLESRSAADLTSQHRTAEKPPCTDIDGEQEKEDSHSRFLEHGTGPGESSSELTFSSSQEKDEIEPMFPKMKVPAFATLQPNIMRNFQSKMPDLTMPAIPEKSRKAEIYLRRLRQMHHLCLVNMSFSQRLLDRQTDSLCWREVRGIQDLVLPSIESKQGNTSKNNQPPLNSVKHPTSVQKPLLLQKPSRPASARHECFETLALDQAECCCKTPDPLSIGDVCKTKST